MEDSFLVLFGVLGIVDVKIRMNEWSTLIVT